MKDEEFYRETRKQIEHEDRLLNNRLTWLLTLQAFLFGAYGFSLSAESTAKPSGATPNQEIIDSIMHTRFWLAIVGILASLLLLIGIAAAAMSMTSLVAAWERRTVTNRENYPQIIGRSFVGIHGGLMPTYFLPIVTLFAWLYLQHDKFGPVAEVILALIVVGFTFYIGYRIGKNRAGVRPATMP